MQTPPDTVSASKLPLPPIQTCRPEAWEHLRCLSQVEDSGVGAPRPKVQGDEALFGPPPVVAPSGGWPHGRGQLLRAVPGGYVFVHPAGQHPIHLLR